MSAGATKHHLRVLRILTIQTVCIMSVSCFVPLAVTSTLFIDVHSYIVSFCLLALGMDSVINSLLTLYFNPVFKRTILTLFQTQFSSLRSNVSSVVAG
ncbi:unnamed protein product [Auanema sp. JU1783]|nr:unnamed protein product [Auanema sp. JU1783]